MGPEPGTEVVLSERVKRTLGIGERRRSGGKESREFEVLSDQPVIVSEQENRQGKFRHAQVAEILGLAKHVEESAIVLVIGSKAAVGGWCRKYPRLVIGQANRHTGLEVGTATE